MYMYDSVKKAALLLISGENSAYMYVQYIQGAHDNH